MDASNPSPSFSISVRASLFLLSTATLVFEINLPRLFSVAQFYHFAFMIVSLALLGFGASGTILSIFPKMGRGHPQRSLGVLALGASLSILGSYLLTNWLPFDSFSIAWDRRQIWILALHYAALALPFFFSGMAVGLLLDIFPASAGTVYAVNLIGSALGCLGALAAPPFLGGEGTVVFSASLAALAGLSAGRQRHKKFSSQSFVALLSGLVVIFGLFEAGMRISGGSSLPQFELQISPYKSLSYALQYPGAETLSQRWNSFSRVDVVSSPGIRSMPGISFRYFNAPPPENGLLIDGDNLSPVVLPNADLSFTPYLPAALAFELRPGAKTLILEPHGGLDLLTAINQGADQIIAVEANPLIVEEAAHIYQLPKIETVIETGRSYLRRTQDQFDLIVFSLSNTYHPVRSGAYSLAEDYRYTLEAVDDALERLNPDGMLVITRWLQVPPSEWLRSFTLAVTALEQSGLDPTERIIAIRSFNIGLLLIKQTPFSEDELETIRTFADERAFDLAYLPGIQIEETNRFSILEEPLYYQTFTGFLSAPSRQAWLDEYTYEVSPPTDNHPFFGHYFKWSQARQIIAELGKSWQPFGGAGYFVMLVLLTLALGMAVIIILLPLIFIRKSTKNGGAPPSQLASATFTYFGLIGLAFLLVEIPLIQRFILYLGHPAYALTATLFAILLFSGIGSQFSSRLPHQTSLAALTITVLITPWLLPTLFDLTLGYSLTVRVIITIAALAPLGFLMGVPFPSGIQKLETAAPSLIPWAWGVNGAFSVISSILAALIALSFGFSWSLFAGAACYTGALAAATRLKG